MFGYHLFVALTLTFARIERVNSQAVVICGIGFDVSSTFIDHPNEGLTGSIPVEVGLLTGLTNWDMSGNLITGSVPSEIGRLSLLQSWDVHDNQIGGTLPSHLGLLTALTRWSMDINSLTGSIPTEIGRLSLLNYWVLDVNQIGGSLPSQLGLLTALTYWSVFTNALTGSIPTELGRLSRLSYWDFSENRIGGTLPSHLGLLASLSDWYIYSNLLTGSIPTELGLLSHLKNWDLRDTKIGGSVSSHLGRLTALSFWGAQNTLLAGTTPSQLDSLTNLSWSTSGTYLILTQLICSRIMDCTNTLTPTETCSECSLRSDVPATLRAVSANQRFTEFGAQVVVNGDQILLELQPSPYSVVGAKIADVVASLISANGSGDVVTYGIDVTPATQRGDVSIAVVLSHATTGRITQTVATFGSLVIQEGGAPPTSTPSTSVTPIPSASEITRSSTSSTVPLVPMIAASGAFVLGLMLCSVLFWRRTRKRFQVAPISVPFPDSLPWWSTLRDALENQPVPQTVRDALEAVPWPSRTVQHPGPVRTHVIDYPNADQWQTLLDAHRLAVQGGVNLLNRRYNTTFPFEYGLAIYLYTLSEPPVHAALTNALLDPKRNWGPTGTSPEIQTWLPFIKLLDTALASLPPALVYSGTCYRGVKHVYPSPAHHCPEKHFDTTGPFSECRFWSSSATIDTMYKEWFAGTKGPRTIFTIAAVKAYRIGILSQIEEENEILFRPLARFQVRSVTPAWTVGSDAFYDGVSLEQIDE